MAEFRLGRIRFVWKDEWAPSTTYFVDDVVRYAGKVYICQVGHTSDTSDFYEDLNIVPSNWNLMSDGQSWRSDWDVDTFYSDGDIVLYGGITYICNTPHTSNSDSALSLEADQDKWDVFAESFIWQGNWAINTQYKKNDVVAYGGITYICRETHQSALSDTSGIDGLAEDSGKWQVINPGLKYRETWSSGTTKYRVNDVVKYGAGLWICTVNHVPDTVFETDVTANRWSQFVEGFEFEDDWSDSTVYQPGDIVRYGGNQYVAKTNHSNTTPTTPGQSDWDLFSEGLRFENDWSIETSYKVGSIVRVNGYSYLATIDSPSIGTFASATADATNRITVTSSAGMVVGMAIRFTGTSFGDINPGATYYVKQVVSATEIIISNDEDLVSTTDVTTDTGGMTVFASAHPANVNFYQRLVSGIAWQGEWQDDVEYEIGDAIRFGANAYICIKKHRSEQDDGSSIVAEGGGADNSRPDQDVTGTYWNVVAIGSEISVLTTQGDLVYYSGSGPTRLPIGTEGQVLRVSDDSIPEWVSLGAVENVYYVATNGVDQPAPIGGLTKDKPWKTIRYACEQVEKGVKNPNARTLIELNRVFIQREVTEYIQNQIANATPGSIWENFDYEDYKCERDVGFVLDALVYDMTHGGNVKTRGAANSLVGGIVEDTPGAYPGLAGEEAQSLAAYNYMLTLISNVLDQEAPSVNYQNTNGDNSTAIVTQYFDASITAEATALPRIQTLTTIITNAIDDGDTSRIPARNFDEVAIMVSTGKYREVLPIIVPEGVCILGDELRGTNVGPAISSVDKTDAKYSIGALGRLESIVNDIVVGNEVTESVGNTEVQSREWPYADTLEQDAVTQLVRSIQQNIDFRIGTTHMASSTDPVGYNDSYLVGYGDARKLVVENKEFLKEEVIAFIAANYPDLKYSRTKCRQDVGYIVDAVAYDLTYGGYSQSLNAGLAYYEGYAGQRLISTSELSATVAAYDFLKSRLQSVIGAILLPTPLQTAVPQFVDTAGSAASITFTNGAIDIIRNLVNGGTDNWPSVTITTIASNVVTTSATHNLQVGDLIVVRSTENGFVKNTRYWIASTPAGNTFTVSETFGGSAYTLTNGTGLSITANKIDYPAVADGVGSTTALITAAETLSAARETIIENVIDDLNEVAYHIDFVVRLNGLTNDDFIVYVGKNDIAHTYVSGGVVTKADDTDVNITNFVYNESTGYATVTTSTDHGLEAGDVVDITNITVSCTSSGETREFVYPSATSTKGNRTKILYIQNKCIRDLRLILEAVSFDFMLDSNFQSIKAGYSYLRSSAAEVFTLNQKQITRDALTNAKTEALANVGGDTTAQARIESLMTIIDDIIYTGSLEGDNCSTGIRNRQYAVLQLERNRDFIVSEIDNWIANTYTSTVTVTQDSTDYINVSDTSWMSRNTAIRFTGATTSGIQTGVTYYVQNVIDSETITIAETRNAQSPLDISAGGDFDVETVGSFTVSLYYNNALCLRDVNTYIDALKYDIKFPGNYKSLYAARYYANAVVGSLEEDCYYLRNATGVRNQTLVELTGDLLPENEYGTSRVSAGAYCSLDPGWGPDDYRGWILTRSPYVQGVTTFGTAAIGQKIDGSLHNGGNDSIVSNDFTQVISDGIGAWVSNNGRAELVSVFTYYAHIGYLSESGGRIRGTNGNCSYGDFGAVAEGFDADEIPNTAVIDNKSGFNAVIGSANTNGDDIFNFEFDHAGNDYTEVAYTITGGGVNVDIEADEFRDDAVFQVRLIDLGDDSSGQFGGDGYLTNANTAQGGTTSSITLAAVDQEVSSAYVGMKVFVDGGAGQGQFGIVSTYNAGTKLANVVRESDGQSGWDHVVPGTTIVSPNASSTYVMEPAISFTSPGFQADSLELPQVGDWVDATFGETAATYTGLSPTSYTGIGTGATFDVVRNGSKYIITLTDGGLDYSRLETFKILGTSLGGETPTNDITFTITAINSVTGEILEYDQEGFGLNGLFVANKSNSGNGIFTSTDGENWSTRILPLPTTNWTGVASGLIDDGSSDLKVSRFVAVATGGTRAAWSADGINWFSSSLPVSASWTRVVFGNGRFVAIASDSTTVAISLDGQVWDVTGTLNSTGFVDVTYGMGKFVAVKTGNTDAVEYSDDGGETWTQEDLPANSTWTSVTWGRGAFVAVASDSNNGAISIDGETWTAMTVGSPDSNDPAGYQRVRYGQGLFIATATLNGQTGYQFVMKSENGLYWTDESIPTAGGIQNDGYNAIVFGNPQKTGYWLAFQNDNGDHAVKIRTGATTRARAFVAQTKIFVIRLTEPGSGYDTAPTMTVTDPNNTFELPVEVRVGKGALATPSFVDRGQEYTSANAEVDDDNSNGFADFYQPGAFIFVRRLSQRPVPGSNIVFGHLPNRTFKLVNVLTFLGQNDGAYTAFFQVSPELTIQEAPENGTSLTTRIRFSQVRLTGHDFLDIGTGSFEETNYPGTPTQDPIPAQETKEGNGGRVFYTSTDQDGNFRVGDLFTIEQSTGVATLNADAFNIAGLQELSLGEVTLGGGSASIDEFSSDPFFTADSDSVVPTQRAIRAFIASQIGGGGASLNVNSVTAGSVFINTNQIRTVDGSVINMRGKFNFKGPVTGYPIAWNYFLV